ncbi:hypothetical protein H3N56_02570 [Cetobacterium sp. 2A]|uniref:hypothetical protein n=1 Tax=Cetobacterium sp. 2A TaxID=2754723 RepID=UPI00163BB422|nr:hypothetical protein [Cetobacterium sp. 2A]MBC2855377.1 hypothetical protein [Cetobacterium sp. 2A]
MIGLDRVVMKTGVVRMDADRLKVNILKKFNLKDDIHANNIEKIYIGRENSNPIFRYINWVKVVKKLGDKISDRCYLEVEINYPKYFEKTNFHLVTNQLYKKKVDFDIKLLLADLLETEAETVILDYLEIEVAEQLRVKIFSDFNNAIYFIFKALCNGGFKTDSKCLYGDYSRALDRFYLTGFSFKLSKGLNLKVYNKTIENNKNNTDSKVLGGELKTELTVTATVLKTMLATTNVEEITLERLRIGISKKLEISIKQSVIDQFKNDEKELIKRLRSLERITPKNMELFVTENNEWIFDADTFNCILHKEVIKNKAESTSKRCQAASKRKLTLLGLSNSPKRNNIKNVERLEIFLKNLFGITLKIKQSRKERILIS